MIFYICLFIPKQRMMNMKRILLTFGLSCMLGLAFAQTAKIEAIRNRYSEFMQMYDDGFLTPVTISLSVNRPAIGPQMTEALFYWNDMMSESYEAVNDAGDVDYVIRRELYLIKTSYNIAASVQTTIEYLYDSTGAPVFCFFAERSEIITEIRFYFDKDQLIKYIYREYALNEEGEKGDQQKEVMMEKNFDKDILQKSQHYYKQAVKLKEYWTLAFGIEGLRD